MKKILVILMMCLVCNVYVDAKAKKEKERPMTEFEQWQKEEKLAYLLKMCEEYYYEAKENERRLVKDSTLIAKRYKEASEYKKRYEELENSNYYVNLDYRDIGRTRYYYNGGYIFEIFFDTDGKAITLKDGLHLYSKGGIEELRKEKEAALSLGRNVAKRINEETGYNERIAKDIESKDEVSEFLNKH